jgi:hypothetical protein
MRGDPIRLVARRAGSERDGEVNNMHDYRMLCLRRTCSGGATTDWLARIAHRPTLTRSASEAALRTYLACASGWCRARCRTVARAGAQCGLEGNGANVTVPPFVRRLWRRTNGRTEGVGARAALASQSALDGDKPRRGEWFGCRFPLATIRLHAGGAMIGRQNVNRAFPSPFPVFSPWSLAAASRRPSTREKGNALAASVSGGQSRLRWDEPSGGGGTLIFPLNFPHASFVGTLYLPPIRIKEEDFA